MKFKGLRIPGGVPLSSRRLFRAIDEYLMRTSKWSEDGGGSIRTDSPTYDGGAESPVKYRTISAGGTIADLSVPRAGTVLVLTFVGTPTLTSNGTMRLQGDFTPRNATETLTLVSDGRLLYEIGRGASAWALGTFVPAALWGAVPDTGADKTAAIQAALDSAAIGATLFFAPGTYVLSALLTCTRPINIYARGAVFDWGTTAFGASDTAFTYGNPSDPIWRCRVEGLQVKRTAAGQLTTQALGVGFHWYALYQCTIVDCDAGDPAAVATGFRFGHWISGAVVGGTVERGCVYNGFFGLGSSGCVRHIQIAPGDAAGGKSGWCNENNFWGGRANFTFTDATGSPPNCYAIYIQYAVFDIYAPNNNRFYGLSLEGSGAGTWGRKIYCEGHYNAFIECRYEQQNGGGVADIEFVRGLPTGGEHNVLLGGVHLDLEAVVYPSVPHYNVRIDGKHITAPQTDVVMKSADIGTPTAPGILEADVSSPIILRNMTGGGELLQLLDSIGSHRLRVGNKGGLTWADDGDVARNELRLDIAAPFEYPLLTSKLAYLDAGGSGKYVGLKAPTMGAAASGLWALPALDGAAAQFLTTDGARQLGWAHPAFVPAASWAAIPDTGTDKTAAIQAALSSAPVGSTLFFAPGTYLLTAAVTCTRQLNIYAVGAVFDWGTTALAGPAFTYGQSVTGLNITRGEIVGLTLKRTVTTWASVYTDDYIGLQVDSCIECTFNRVLVIGFARGVRLVGNNVAAMNSKGCYLNTFHGLETRNCMHHVTLEQTGASDFVNDNAFYDWRIQNDSTLGTAADISGVTDYRYGVEQLRILWGGAGANTPNANRFIGCLFESTSARPVKRKARIEGAFQYFAACRYEGHRARSFATFGGSGADGAAFFDGINDYVGIARIGLNYTLTQNFNFTDITVASAGVNVNLAGFTMNYSVSLTLNGTIDGGYDITIGDLDHINANFQENIFHYGYEMRDIVVNDRVEFLGSDSRPNNKNHFYSEWGIVILGGSGARPPLRLGHSGGGTNPALEICDAATANNPDMGFSAGGGLGSTPAIHFWDAAGAVILNDIYINRSTSKVGITSGLHVGTDADAQTFTARNDTLPGDVGVLKGHGDRQHVILEALRRGQTPQGQVVLTGGKGGGIAAVAAHNISSSTAPALGVMAANANHDGAITWDVSANPTSPNRFGLNIWRSLDGTQRNSLGMRTGSPYELLVEKVLAWLSADGAEFWAGFKAPNLTASTVWTLPVADGAAGQVLTTNGAGALSFQAQAFPVGSIFTSVVAANPATLLGYGTWNQVGAGRVLVGIDTWDDDFETVGQTGGAKTHTLTDPETPDTP